MDLIKELKNIKDGHWNENSFGALDSIIKMLEEGVTLKGCIARDKDGQLTLFSGKVIREDDMWCRDLSDENLAYDYGFLELGKNKFPELKWKDEPLDVEITIRKCG